MILAVQIKEENGKTYYKVSNPIEEIAAEVPKHDNIVFVVDGIELDGAKFNSPEEVINYYNAAKNKNNEAAVEEIQKIEGVFLVTTKDNVPYFVILANADFNLVAEKVAGIDCVCNCDTAQGVFKFNGKDYKNANEIIAARDEAFGKTETTEKKAENDIFDSKEFSFVGNNADNIPIYAASVKLDAKDIAYRIAGKRAVCRFDKDGIAINCYEFPDAESLIAYYDKRLAENMSKQNSNLYAAKPGETLEDIAKKIAGKDLICAFNGYKIYGSKYKTPEQLVGDFDRVKEEKLFNGLLKYQQTNIDGVRIYETLEGVKLEDVADKVVGKKIFLWVDDIPLKCMDYDFKEDLINAYNVAKKEPDDTKKEQPVDEASEDLAAFEEVYDTIYGKVYVPKEGANVSYEDIGKLIVGKNIVCKYNGIYFNGKNYSDLDKFKAEFDRLISEKEAREKASADSYKDSLNVFISYINALGEISNKLEDGENKNWVINELTSLAGIVVKDFDSFDRNAIVNDVNNVSEFVFAGYAKVAQDKFETIRPYRDFIEPTDFARLASMLNTMLNEKARGTDRVKACQEFDGEFTKVVTKLHEDEIIKENGNANISKDSRPFFVRPFVQNKNQQYTDTLSSTMDNLDRLQVLASEYSKGYYDKGDEIIEIIKQLNSTTRRLEKLNKKEGKLRDRQQSIMADVDKIKEEINTRSLKYGLPDAILDKVDDLREAVIANEQSGGKNKKAVHKAEKALYGRFILSDKKKDKIGDLLEQRKKIIESAQEEQEFSSDKEYRKAYDKFVSKLEKKDRKLFGRKTTKAIYARIKDRQGYLFNPNTNSLMLPKELLNLSEYIDDAYGDEEENEMSMGM